MNLPAVTFPFWDEWYVGERGVPTVSSLIMCQDVSKDDIPEARKLAIFKEKVTIKTKVDSGYPNFKELSNETLN